MSSVFLIIGAVFAFLAGVIHVLIFLLESVLWTRPTVWRRFGVKTDDEASVLQPMAFNQGFYNLFLAIGTGIGLVLLGNVAGRGAGEAITFFALACMLGASLVLVLSNPKLFRAALLQGAAPLIGIIFLALTLTTS
jgi:putative membrane protein